jgi:hypothetical protein
MSQIGLPRTMKAWVRTHLACYCLGAKQAGWKPADPAFSRERTARSSFLALQHLGGNFLQEFRADRRRQV